MSVKSVNPPVTKQECIDAYKSQNLVLFALNGKTAKSPAQRGWRQLKTTPDKLPDMYAVQLPVWLFVIDFDPARGEDDLRRFTEQLNLGTHETFVVGSGRQGLHIYYRTTYQGKLPARIPGFDALEIKTLGRYVVGAGSEYFSKGKRRRYRVVRGSIDAIAELPESILNYVTENYNPVKATSGTEEFFDDVGTQQRFIAYLMRSTAVNSSSYELACQGRAFGLSPDVITDLMMEYLNPRWDDQVDREEMRAKVENAFQYGQNESGSLHPANDFKDEIFEETAGPKKHPELEDDIWWDQTPKGEVAKTLNNAVNYFKIDMIGNPQYENPLKGLLRYNCFTEYIEFNKPAPWHTEHTASKTWTDGDTTQLMYFLSKNCKFDAVEALVTNAVFVASQFDTRHPLKDWLLPLKWDGKPRINWFLRDYCGAVDAPSKYLQAISKNFFIASVARVIDPGCKYDDVLVFEGEQDIKKSMLVETLSGDFYVDMLLDPAAKETVQTMGRGWILELAEMEFTSRAEVKAVKRFLSCKVDYIRLPYETHINPHPRHSVFIGSINPEGGYLKDSTGNRRFKPIKVTEIDIEAVKRDRDQLFAEALHRYRQKEIFWLEDESVKAEARAMQMERFDKDPWQAIIERELEGLDITITTEYIAEMILTIPVSRFGKMERNRIATCMRLLGYQHVQQRIGIRRFHVWEKPGVDLGDV